MPSQVKLLLPKFHRADSALRSQAAGGVGYVRLLLHRRSAAKTKKGAVLERCSLKISRNFPLFAQAHEGVYGTSKSPIGKGAYLPNLIPLKAKRAAA